MFIKVLLLCTLFPGCMAAIGAYCRKHTRSVGDFVLGGRSVGPWLTAFAYGTSYFSAVVFIGYAGQFGWAYGVSATWIWHWQRADWQPARLGGAGPPYAHHDGNF